MLGLPNLYYTAYQSLILLQINMSYYRKKSVRGASLDSINRTMPLKNTNNQQQSDFHTHRDTESNLTQTKLPVIQIKRVMKKIGAIDKELPLFTPSQQEQNSFRKAKWAQLKNQFVRSKHKKKVPYDYELDQIVLDVWQYGEDFGNKTIWKKYKQKFDQLSFDTMKVVKKKKL